MFNATIFGKVTNVYDKRVVGSDKQSVMDITVVVNHRARTDSGEWVDEAATFQKVTLWGKLADRFEESLEKGDFVIVTGTITTGKKYINKDGEERTPQSSLRATSIGPDIRFGKVTVERKAKKDDGNANRAKKEKAPAQSNNNFDDDIFDNEDGDDLF